jgi:hypothetical protein
LKTIIHPLALFCNFSKSLFFSADNRLFNVMFKVFRTSWSFAVRLFLSEILTERSQVALVLGIVVVTINEEFA